MKMRNYLKKKQERATVETQLDEITASKIVYRSMVKRKLMYSFVIGLLTVPVLLSIFVNKELKKVSIGTEENVQMVSSPVAAVAAKRSVISIPAGIVKSNPFLPYRDIDDVKPTSDVPTTTLVEPPESLNMDSDAARVMDTIVSGILYDKFSPSAILNIEGNDYLVKKGDVVNNYRVLSIMQDSVTVKLGANVYKAGIGEILTEGSLNHNDVSNLNNKFGGER